MIDLINSCFGFSAGIFLWYNCYLLYKDKQVRGISVAFMLFYTLWGVWNFYYYPSLGQWCSLVGSIFGTAANAVWVVLAIYYKRKLK